MKALTMFCAIAVCICWAAFASPVDTINVNFPNPVVVGETALPAGNVTIQVLRGSTNVVLNFRSESGVTVSAMANRINELSDRDDSAGATIVLGREANTLKLERVLFPDHTGFELLQSSR
jgi:hypothetical protein